MHADAAEAGFCLHSVHNFKRALTGKRQKHLTKPADVHVSEAAGD